MATQIGSGTGVLATYLANLTDTANIETALKQLYYGTTGGTLSTSTGIYGALYTLYTGNPTLAGNVTITGSLTVNGTTTTINANTLVVDDKNIEIGSVSSGVISTTGTIGTVSGTGPYTATITNMTGTSVIPGQVITATNGTGSFGAGVMTVASIVSSTSITVSSTLTFTAGTVTNITGAAASDSSANGGGITLKGTTDKSIIWDSTNSNWTTSEHWNLASGKALKINNVSLIDTNAPKSMANLMGYTSTATAAGTTTLTNTSSYYQVFTGSTTQTVVLPVTSTLQTGWTFHIANNSTGNVTVNSSGGNQVIVIIPGTTAMVTCIGTTLTTAADWEAGLTDFSTYTGTGNLVMATSPTLTNITTAAGTTSLAPIRMTQATAGTWLATPLGGAIESTVEASYLTVANGPGRGIIRAPQMVYRLTTTPSSSVNTAVNVFDTANDVLSSLEANKLYRFKGAYLASVAYTSPFSSALQLLFTFSNAPASFNYRYKTYAQTPSGTPLVHGGLYSTTAASSVTASLSATASYFVEFEGYFVSHATLTSTFTPQFQGNASTSTNWVITAGSYLEIEKVGTGTQTLIAGNWA